LTQTRNAQVGCLSFALWLFAIDAKPLCPTLLVVAPHAKHLDSTFVFDDLIDEAMLNIDAARVYAAQIPDEFLKRAVVSERDHWRGR
jgi:hypothetical protein